MIFSLNAVDEQMLRRAYNAERFRPGSDSESREAVIYLMENGLIEAYPMAIGWWRITAAGKAALEDLK